MNDEKVTPLTSTNIPAPQRPRFNYWVANFILIGVGLLTFFILGGCGGMSQNKEQVKVQESKEKVSAYINNSINQVTPPEIMDAAPASRSSKGVIEETPPVHPAMNMSF